MDINKIFGTFDSRGGNESSKTPIFFNPIDENHPRYFVNVFQKLIINYLQYGNEITKLLTSSTPKIEVEEVKRYGENMLYNRALDYLIKVDIQDKYHIKVLFEETNPKLKESLNSALKYFESEEEYEKCAILKKYLDFLNFSS